MLEAPQAAPVERTSAAPAAVAIVVVVVVVVVVVTLVEESREEYLESLLREFGGVSDISKTCWILQKSKGALIKADEFLLSLFVTSWCNTQTSGSTEQMPVLLWTNV
uniref:Uncharacterized protein n=1 Tax=Vespula pensylvanica TaxID=30213 RepID=A0A834N8G9_VESPE|nr:hypothetical protein H0235_015834 [Vespula pensylvanica]